MRAAALLLIAAAAGAQTPSPLPAFDAASVKQNRSGGNGMGGYVGIKPGGSLSMRNVSVQVMITIAYDIRYYQLGGGPAWIHSSGYDIEAKPEHEVDTATARLMFQNLLAERFQLQAHHEDSTVNGFHLVVDKGGSKLKPPNGPGVGFHYQQAGKIQGNGDMRMLTLTLGGILGVPVENHTDSAGAFDISLLWTPDDAAPPAGAASEPSITLFAAIKQQLGLSLEATKIPIDKLVIDRVERPTEN